MAKQMTDENQEYDRYNGLKKLDRNLITLKFLPYEKIKTKIHI